MVDERWGGGGGWNEGTLISDFLGCVLSDN